MPHKLSIKTQSLANAISAKTAPRIERAVSATKAQVIGVVTNSLSSVLPDAQRDAYIAEVVKPDNIQVTERQVTIKFGNAQLTGIEFGFDAFDIKAKMLQHATKFAKDGTPYTDVPFAHTLSKTPLAVQAAMRSASRQAEGVARVLGRTPGQQFSRTLHFGEHKVTTHVEHTRSIYDNLIHTARGQYNTIRRISAKSAATSWWHPGYRGLHIFEKAFRKINSDMRALLVKNLQEQGFKIL